MRARCLAGLIAVCLLVWTAGSGRAQIIEGEGLADALRAGAIELRADSLDYERERGLYTARGNVVIIQKDRTIRADWVSFNELTGVGVASGNVVVDEGGDTLRAAFIEFDVYGVKGVVRDGRFDSSGSQFRAWGREIEKTGESTYTFRDGVFTTCECPDDESAEPWRITAEEADLEIGGYAVVRNSTVEILGVPVVWLPWMIYPVKTERQSGLLLPEIDFGSRNGFGVGLPVFLALHEQVNLTLTPSYSTKRGGKGKGELEYVFGRESWGELTGTYGYDLDVDRSRGANGNPGDPFRKGRWSLQGKQDWLGPADLRFQSRFDFVSDNQLPIDYSELEKRRPDRYLLATASLGRHLGSSGRFGAAATARFADDMQNPDDRDRDKSVLQRLPGAEGVALPSPAPWLPRLVPSMEADYAYFTRLGDLDRGGSDDFLDLGVDAIATPDERPRRNDPNNPDPHRDDFDDDDSDLMTNRSGTEGDLRFQEGEPLVDRGHRLWLHPRLAAPFQIGPYAEVYPEIGWNQTIYDTHLEGFDQRGILTARVDARMRLSGRVGELRHVIEPLAGWAYIRTQSQRNNPRLVPGADISQDRLRVLDLDSVTRDDADRIQAAHLATLGVSNRFESQDGRRNASVTVLGVYDAVENSINQVVVDATARSLWGAWTRLQLAYDPSSSEIREGLASAGWSHSSGFKVRGTYRYLQRIPETFEDFPFGDRWDSFKRLRRVNQLRAGINVPLTRSWTVAYDGAYSFERELLMSNDLRVEYTSKCRCWSAGIEIGTDRAGGAQAKLLYRIEGFGFDPGPEPAGLLDGS